MVLVLDTGPIVALLDADDPAHRSCVEAVADHPDLVIPVPVLVEVDYWVRKLLGTKVWGLSSKTWSAGGIESSTSAH